MGDLYLVDSPAIYYNILLYSELVILIFNLWVFYKFLPHTPYTRYSFGAKMSPKIFGAHELFLYVLLYYIF